MRAVHVIKGLGRGGAESLIAHERDIIYFLPWKNTLAHNATLLEAHSNLGILARASRLRRMLDGFDVAHAHLPIAGIATRLAAEIPVLYTEHNVWQRYHPLTQALNVATWHLQRAVIAVSDQVAASITRKDVPVHVVRNGIDVQSFRPTPTQGTTVGTIAVFRKQKDLPTWIAAAKRIQAKRPKTRFLLVGAGPEPVDTDGLDIEMPGLVDDPRPYLARMDVFMMSSIHEGLPLALLEAMATGRPIVATSVGGVPEAVGSAGLLVPPRDPQSLAEAALRLLDEPGMYGEQARARVEEHFAVQRMRAELRALYERYAG